MVLIVKDLRLCMVSKYAKIGYILSELVRYLSFILKRKHTFYAFAKA